MGGLSCFGRFAGKLTCAWDVCVCECEADCDRFPKIMYTEEGRNAMERLWMETVVELEFAGVKQILGLAGPR